MTCVSQYTCGEWCDDCQHRLLTWNEYQLNHQHRLLTSNEYWLHHQHGCWLAKSISDCWITNTGCRLTMSTGGCLIINTGCWLTTSTGGCWITNTGCGLVTSTGCSLITNACWWLATSTGGCRNTNTGCGLAMSTGGCLITNTGCCFLGLCWIITVFVWFVLATCSIWCSFQTCIKRPIEFWNVSQLFLDVSIFCGFISMLSCYRALMCRFVTPTGSRFFCLQIYSFPILILLEWFTILIWTKFGCSNPAKWVWIIFSHQMYSLLLVRLNCDGKSVKDIKCPAIR